MACTYKVPGQDDLIKGVESLKSWLVNGGMDALYPDGNYPWINEASNSSSKLEGDIKFSRSQSTKESYEKRIDELYESDKPIGAIKVLDRSDILDLLGYRNEPLYLNEKKVIDGRFNHGLTKEHWKKIPEWLDDPAFVFDSYTVKGRLVAVAPELADGKPVYMILDPDYKLNRLSVQLLVNAYDDNNKVHPLARWVSEGLLRYENEDKARSLRTTKGLQLPSVVHAKNKGGFKILHRSDLVKYHNEQSAKRSVGKEKPGSTVEQIRSWIPTRVKPMLDAGKLEIVQSVHELPERIIEAHSTSSGIEGLYDYDKDLGRDKIYLVADMLTKDNLPAVLAHELLHRGETQDAKLKAAIDRFESDLDVRFKAAARGYGSPIDKKAYARVISANTSEKNQAAEFRAYMVSEYMRSPNSLTGRLKKIFADFVASVRAFLIRNGLDFGFVKSLTPADLAALSKYGARVYQQGNTDNKILGQLASVFEWQGSAYDFQELELSGAFNDEFAKKKREFESIKQKLTENKKSDRETAGEKVGGVRFSISSPEDQQGNESSNEFLRKFLNEKAKDKLIYNLQDRYVDLKRQMQKVVNNGGNIAESEDAYLGEEVYHQRAAARIKSFMDDELAPVLRGLHRHKIDMDTFQKFLHARHAPSRNAVMAERNPNQSIIDANIKSAQQALDALLADPNAKKRDISAATRELEKWEKAQPFKGTEEERLSLSGMSNDEASRFINGLPKQERVIMTNLADKIDAINNKTLDLLVDYNMETPETIQALKDQWQHYVPLHRDEAHPEEGNFGHPIGRGFSVSGNGMKNATGSNAEVTNILAHVASAREQMIRRGEKNNVTVKLANLIHNHPDSDFAELSKIETHKVLDDGLVKTVHDPLFVQRGRDHVVMFRAKGKDFAIVFNERNPENVRLALSLKNMDGVTLDNVEAFIARGTRWLSSVNTQYNLVFGLINLLRDTQGMMLNLTSTPLAGKQRAIFAKMWRAIKIISAAERGWENVDPELKAIYDQFNLAGGTTGYSQMFDGIKQRDDFLRKELDLLDAGDARKAWKWFTKSLSDFNTVMENATRLAVFMQAKEQGLSDTKAASLSKNITVNFNRKGAYTTKVGAGYAFFNASMQGTARMYETLSGPKGRQIMLGGILLGAATALLGILGMGDDEWEKIPEFVRERSFISPVPEFIKKDRYVAFPMPLGFHIFPNIGRKIVEALIGSNRVSATQRFLQLAGSAAGAFNPLGGSDFATTITPTVADPIVGLLRNKDWTGRQIYREDFSQLNPTPGFTRTKDTATGGSKLAAEAINKLMGGTDAKQGLWSPTPDQIDYVFGQIFGGTGRELMKAEQVIEALFSGEELPAHKIPLVGRLYGETTGGSVESQAYYENLLKMHEHKAEIEYLREHGRAGEVTGYVANNPEARVLGATKRIEDQVDKMKKRRKQLKENDADKAKIRVMDNAITAKMKQLNDLVAAQ